MGHMAEEIGVIVVHGIGEQGRFEHLDAQIRGLINGLRRCGYHVTVEIMSSVAAEFQARQETWRAGPHAALRLVVSDADGLRHINLHEVWWADVNERYSLRKQARFWLWGLSVWFYPARPSSSLPTTSSMFPPRSSRSSKLWGVRLRLLLVGSFFLLASLTIGVAAALLKRLLNFEPPDLIKIFVNYLSSIKLYNQNYRVGPTGRKADFLDAIGNPPRSSIRRRMIRAIADVASRNYSRWYILAHSQGSVVAFNGLMEPAFGWPGYLDERRWNRLREKKMAGPALFPGPSAGRMVPPPPKWLPPNEIAYRTKIFARFEGLLTYGCPLEKFAAIWPALVAVCREPAFARETRWLNVFDPLDPVSGLMRSWPTADPEYCPPPENIGYATSSCLLLGHIKYLECPDPQIVEGVIRQPSQHDLNLADGVATWIAAGNASSLLAKQGARFFSSDDHRFGRRRAAAAIQWTIAFVFVTALAGLAISQVLPLVWRLTIALAVKLKAVCPARTPPLGASTFMVVWCVWRRRRRYYALRRVATAYTRGQRPKAAAGRAFFGRAIAGAGSDQTFMISVVGLYDAVDFDFA